jgi:hypothetical protein
MLQLLRTFHGSWREFQRRRHLQSALKTVERQRPILVYQMGKVGSSTVVSTLEQLRLKNPVLHVHTLVAERLREAQARQRRSQRPFLDEHLQVSSILLPKLETGRFPCHLVTLTREPIARAISFVFEDWKKKTPRALLENGHLDDAAMKQAIESLLSEGSDHADPGQWFDKELKRSFGLDVFSVPYDESRGYTLVRTGDVSLLILRMEDLNRSLPAALGDLLGIDSQAITMSRANEADEKWYARSMDVQKRSFRLPRETLDRIFSSRYMRHFYPNDIERLRTRWEQTPSDAASVAANAIHPAPSS